MSDVNVMADHDVSIENLRCDLGHYEDMDLNILDVSETREEEDDDEEEEEEEGTVDMNEYMKNVQAMQQQMMQNMQQMMQGNGMQNYLQQVQVLQQQLASGQISAEEYTAKVQQLAAQNFGN